MSADNFMREYLVTKFACANCGQRLNLSYRPKECAATRPGYVMGEPTGAAMVEQVVYLEPCEACLAPARDAQRAMQTLVKIAGGVRNGQ